MNISFTVFKIITFVLGCWESYLCFDILDALLKRQARFKWRRVLHIIFSIILGGIALWNKIDYLMFSTFVMMISIVVTTLVSKITYQAKITLIAISSITFYILTYSLDLVYLYAGGIIWENPNIGIEIVSTTPEISIFYSIFTRVTLWLIIRQIKKHIQLNDIKIEDYIKLLLFFDVVGFLGIIYFQRIFLVEMTTLLVFNGFTYICTALFGALAFMVYIMFQRSKEKTVLIQLRNELLEKNHESMKFVYDQNAKVFHDFRNHLAVLHTMLEEGQHEQAMTYIERVREPLISVTKRIDSRNEAIDIVLNYKVAEAEEKMIEVETLIKDCNCIKIPNNDMSTLISNALDNAIEAAEKMPEEKRWIKIQTYKKNQFWIFQVSNSISQAPDVRNGKLRSLKKEGIHGYGMENIKEIIDKYDGYMTYDYDQDKFELNLYLNI